MCTGFVHRGKDLLYGFNLDIDPNVWSFDVYKTKNYFTVGIKVGSTTYFTHGVNRNGNFGNLPYMNGEEFKCPKGCAKQRIDLLIDKYIRGKLSFDEIRDIVNTKTLTNAPAATMHSLVGDIDGNILLLEPGYGIKEIDEKYGVIANFPVLARLNNHDNQFYGKERYDTVSKALAKADDDFSADDALGLLEKVKQTGQWATRVSFVYSRNDNSVYYCLDNRFDEISVHEFAKL